MSMSKKRNYDSTQKFQKSWDAKLSWVEMCLGSNDCLHIVECKIYDKIDSGKNKLPAPK